MPDPQNTLAPSGETKEHEQHNAPVAETDAVGEGLVLRSAPSAAVTAAELAAQQQGNETADSGGFFIESAAHKEPAPSTLQEEPEEPAEASLPGEVVENGGEEDAASQDASYILNADVYDRDATDEPIEAARLELSAFGDDDDDDSSENAEARVTAPGQIMTDDGPVMIAPMTDDIGEELPPDEPEEATELLHILEGHQLWLSSQHTEGKRGDFRRFELAGHDFSGMQLAEANFRGVNLAGAKFDRADLQGADLSDTNLVRASFVESNLSGANLSRAEADYGNFEHANMTSANLNGAELRGTRFRNVQLPGAILRDTIMHNAVMMQANLREAVLKNANLLEAVLEDADMTSADCRGANFERASFTRALVDHAEFRGANMSGTDLNTTNFAHALNVDTEFQAQSYETSRQELQEDLHELESLRHEISRREKAMYNDKHALEREREMLVSLHAEIMEPVSRLRRHIKWFKISSIAWLVLSLAFLTFTINAVSQIDSERLNLLELGIVAFIVIAVTVLFIGSFLSAVVINRHLNQMHILHQEGQDALTEKQHSGAAAPHASAENTSLPPASGAGFGKKTG